MKKALLKKQIALLLIFTVVICCIPAKSSSASSLVTVGFCEDEYFKATSKVIDYTLYIPCKYVSVYGECSIHNPNIHLTCYIIDLDHGGAYHRTIRFNTDTNVYTFKMDLPAGNYRVFFESSAKNRKIIKEAIVAFSALV